MKKEIKHPDEATLWKEQQAVHEELDVIYRKLEKIEKEKKEQYVDHIGKIGNFIRKNQEVFDEFFEMVLNEKDLTTYRRCFGPKDQIQYPHFEYMEIDIYLNEYDWS